MKRLFGKFLATLAICSLMTLTAQAEAKIGLIDLRKVFDDYYKTIQASANLKSEVADLEKQIKEMAEDFKKGEEDWKKLLDKANDQAVSSEERAASKQAAEKKLVELKGLEQTVTQFQRREKAKLDEKNRIKRNAILQEIKDAVNQKAKAGGYSMILDSAASSVNETPIVMFTSGENDLTDSILKQLNASAPPLTAAPEKK